MTRPWTLAGGAFESMHRRLVGVEIDWALLDIKGIAPELLQRARATWQERIRTEYRSAQLMTRFLTETLAAGDPFDVHAGIVELIEDELRHVALCAGVVTALGAQPLLPPTLEIKQGDGFERMPSSQRALSIAISMLIVNETLSVGYIADLAERCDTPVIKDVLAATLEDEAEHDAFGAQYVKQALAAFPIGSLPQWQKLALESYAKQQEHSLAVVEKLAPPQRLLEAHPDRELVALGLFSQERQALLFVRNRDRTLLPLLRSLNLEAP